MNINSLAVETLTLEDTFLTKFRNEILAGLGQTPKRLPSKYFYDQEGDKIFQAIMASPEYYLTNCELEIFRKQTAALAAILLSAKEPFDLIELGAGDASKSQYLFQYLADQPVSFRYMPIDISGNILAELKSRLQAAIPNLAITCLQGEYLHMLTQAGQLSSRRKVVMFLGANIGNMEPDEALRFCRQLHQSLNPQDLILIGFDLKKHPKRIWQAYNDKAGLTSRFNLNLLRRINRELEADFNLDQFEHYQTYDPDTGACKSYLVSLQDQTVTIGHQQVAFARDETIFTEISQKYTLAETEEMARKAGFAPIQNFIDAKAWFADVFWVVK